jgi:hypothetical protein
MATAEIIDRRESHVTRWRFDELRRAGFEREDALVVASTVEVDLHLATRLLRDGCPRQTALRILL